MKHFIAVGDRLTIIAPADIASGEGVLVGTLFGVAEGAAATGGEVALELTGVFDLPKAPSQAWTTGAAIYWNATEARCTTVGTGNRRGGAGGGRHAARNRRPGAAERLLRHPGCLIR